MSLSRARTVERPVQRRGSGLLAGVVLGDPLYIAVGLQLLGALWFAVGSPGVLGLVAIFGGTLLHLGRAILDRREATSLRRTS